MSEIYSLPRLPRTAVNRDRISQILSQGSGLTVVRGVTGSGKTTAVAHWAASRPSEAPEGVWLSVDSDTTGSETFWRAVLQLLSDAGIIGHSSLLHDLLVKPRDGGRMLRHELIRALAQHGRPLVLIADNFHLCEQDVVDDIVAIVQASPLIHIVVMTRAGGTLDSDRIDIALSPTRIRNRDLLFTIPEIADLLRHRGVADADGSIAATIRECSGGLAVVVTGVLVTLSQDDVAIDADSVRQRIAGDGLFDHFWGGELARNRDVNHLIRLSIAETLTPALAIGLTGSANAPTILDFLATAGLGSWQSSVDGPVFTIGRRLRDGLRRELYTRPPEELSRLRGDLMRCELDRGHFSSALGHAVALGEFDVASDIVINHYASVLSEHRAETIATLSALPRRTIARQPLLAMALGVALNGVESQRERALEMLGIAIAAMRKNSGGLDPVRRVLLLNAENVALRISGKPEQAVEVADRAARLLSELALDERDRLEPILGAMLPHLGLSFFYDAQEHRAMEFFEASRMLPGATRDPGHLHGLALSAGALALAGDMTEARWRVAEAREEGWPSSNRFEYPEAFLHIAEAMLSVETGDYAEALTRVSLLSPGVDTTEHWPLFAHVQAMALLGMGRPLEAATALEQALRPGARPALMPVSRRRLDAVLSLLLIAAGQPRRAESVLAQHDPDDSYVANSFVRLHLASGNVAAAQAVLDQGPPVGTPRRQAETSLLKASVAVRLGRDGTALDHFESAVLLMNDRGMRHPFALLSENLRSELLALARRSGRLSRYEKLLDDLEALPSVVPGATKSVDLTERELVVLRELGARGSAAEIAAELYVSVNTVKSQLRSIYRKLGVGSRDEAIRAASRLGLYDR
ncbi:helix-turn-helix transcriptional regulator [Salinibacterium hongtaonis]|uniref:HTH luxR-type domain-containing protein n=1 Tax=Homoserinimonas hongtaonis TaxID=2079791 RepID=A0A2U1T1B3_9MICO|nr:LuxR C-terminal-related transcriptional regulator [Salinibacterium hongtaonis]PWB97669.1 hypothetical protein DF220_07380 [Salinibacterium hongtaonis]